MIGGINNQKDKGALSDISALTPLNVYDTKSDHSFVNLFGGKPSKSGVPTPKNNERSKGKLA